MDQLDHHKSKCERSFESSEIIPEWNSSTDTEQDVQSVCKRLSQ